MNGDRLVSIAATPLAGRLADRLGIRHPAPPPRRAHLVGAVVTLAAVPAALAMGRRPRILSGETEPGDTRAVEEAPGDERTREPTPAL